MDILTGPGVGGGAGIRESVESLTLDGVINEGLSQDLPFQLRLQMTTDSQWRASQADRVISAKVPQSRQA